MMSILQLPTISSTLADDAVENTPELCADGGVEDEVDRSVDLY